jgi:hypothetical protein
MDINLGSITIPINAATKTFAILAKRGAAGTAKIHVVSRDKQNVQFQPITVCLRKCPFNLTPCDCVRLMLL